MVRTRIGRWRRRAFWPAVAALVMGALAAALVEWVGFAVFPPHGVGGWVMGTASGLEASMRMAASGFMRSSWQEWAEFLRANGVLGAVAARTGLAVATAIVTGVLGFAGLMMFEEDYRVGMRHVRGRILRRGHHARRAAATEFAKAMRAPGNGPGLFLAPGVQMDRKRETEGIYVLGAPGSGKTVWFRFLIDQILERGEGAMRQLRAGVPLGKLPLLPDKAIVVDVKSDQTEQWPNDQFMLLAPHDTGMRTDADGVPKRLGVAWDVGKDVVGAPAARDLAARIVKATDEPVWGDAARGIFTGMIRGLQQQHGTAWGWRELYDVVSLGSKELQEYLQKWDPTAAQFVHLENGAPNRTTASYLANITTGVVPMVEALAAGWGDYPADARVSLREWILDPLAEKRTLVLQRSGTVREISGAWIRAVLFFLASFATSPELVEDSRRRVWFICDEAPQYLSKDDGFLEIIETGRSKGFCAMVAAQVHRQFEKVWSEAEMATLEAMMRTTLIFRTSGGAVADHLAEKVVGSSDWERVDLSHSYGREHSHSRSVRVERELVVMPSFFSEELGAEKGGVKMCWVGPKDVCVLKAPYPKWKPRRAATVPAPWVKDNKFRIAKVTRPGQGDGGGAPGGAGGGAAPRSMPAGPVAGTGLFGIRPGGLAGGGLGR